MPSQSEFAAALLDPALPFPRGLIGESAHFNIYRNNVVASLTSALERTFPVVERMLGEDYFRALAAEFVRRHPPANRVVAVYGAGFAAFLGDFEPLRDYPYLPDLARLEWARLEAWHSTEHVVMDRQLPDDPERLLASQLTLVPATRLVVSDWPVVSLWDAHQPDEFSSPEIWDGEALAVFRRDGRLIHAQMSPRHARFLQRMERLSSLGDALVELSDEDEVAEAMRLAVNLLRAGCIMPTMNNYW